VVEVFCRRSHRRIIIRNLRVVWVETPETGPLTAFRVVDPAPVTLDGSTVVTDEERARLAARIAAGGVGDLSSLPELRPVTSLRCRTCKLEVNDATEAMAPVLGEVILTARRAGEPPSVALAELARKLSSR
jgi:hypothetical protein